jgi:hypothetical protein
MYGVLDLSVAGVGPPVRLHVILVVAWHLASARAVSL